MTMRCISLRIPAFSRQQRFSNKWSGAASANNPNLLQEDEKLMKNRGNLMTVLINVYVITCVWEIIVTAIDLSGLIFDRWSEEGLIT